MASGLARRRLQYCSVVQEKEEKVRESLGQMGKKTPIERENTIINLK